MPEAQQNSGPSPAQQEMALRKLLTYRLSVLSMKLRRQAIFVLRKVGLTLPAWRVISLLASCGSIVNKDVCQTIDIDKGQLSRTIRALEKQGILRVSDSSVDRRSVVLTLTENGRRVFERTLPAMEARQRLLMGALTRDEQAILFGVFDKLEVAAEIRSFDGAAAPRREPAGKKSDPNDAR